MNGGTPVGPARVKVKSNARFFDAIHNRPLDLQCDYGVGKVSEVCSDSDSELLCLQFYIIHAACYASW